MSFRKHHHLKKVSVVQKLMIPREQVVDYRSDRVSPEWCFERYNIPTMTNFRLISPDIMWNVDI